MFLTYVQCLSLPDLKYILTMGPEKYPGTFRFDDVLTSATPAQRQSIFDLQDQLQFDDPVNIQFTSVRYDVSVSFMFTYSLAMYCLVCGLFSS